LLDIREKAAVRLTKTRNSVLVLLAPTRSRTGCSIHASSRYWYWYYSYSVIIRIYSILIFVIRNLEVSNYKHDDRACVDSVAMIRYVHVPLIHIIPSIR
jgi:hypothetical protein